MFDRLAGLKRIRTVTELNSATKFVRREFRAGVAHRTQAIDGGVVHLWDVENALEGGLGTAVMLEVRGMDRWVLARGLMEVLAVAAPRQSDAHGTGAK